MILLGLTGGYAAGKNLAASLLEARGWRCVDVDRLGHAALESRAREVAALLGPEILDGAGRPLRAAIGSRVFADPGLLAAYEAIVHPAMFALVDAEIDKARAAGQRLCLNAAILYRMPQARACDLIVELRAPLPLRIRRAMRRDGLGPLRVLERICAQRRLFALRAGIVPRPRIVRNSGGTAALARALDRAILPSPAGGEGPSS